MQEGYVEGIKGSNNFVMWFYTSYGWFLLFNSSISYKIIKSYDTLEVFQLDCFLVC